MLGYVSAFYIAPSLIQAQLPSPSSQADLKFLVGLSARPAVVRVVAGCYGTYSYNGNEYPMVAGEIGSGYFVDPKGYIVTNSHVVRSGETGGCQEKLLKRLTEQITVQDGFGNLSEQKRSDIRKSSQLLGAVSYTNRVVLPNGASFPFEIREFSNSSGGNDQDVAVIKINVENAPTLKLERGAKIQDSAIVIGYFADQDTQGFSSPIALKDLSLGKSLTTAKILRGQILSSTPTERGVLPLKFDAKLPSGIAGSPVVNNNGEVIGMATASDTEFEQGSSVVAVIPTNVLQAVVKRSGAINQESATNRLYEEGVKAFDQKDYVGAKAKFKQVKQLFPYHSEISWLVPAVDQKLGEAQGQKNTILKLVGAGLAALGFIGIYLFSKRLQPAKPANSGRPMLAPELIGVRTVPPIAAEPVEPPPVVSEPVEQPTPTIIAKARGSIFSPATVISTQPFIELKNQDGQVRRFYLRKERHRLGRDRDWADFYIGDSGWEVLSRHHAVIEKDGADYRIFDGDRKIPSTNGIFLDETAITTHEGYLLKDGDKLRTGDDSRSQVTLIYSNPGGRLSSHPTQTDTEASET